MRFISLAALFLPLAAGCGGGGGSAPTLQTAALQGVVYEVDGQTLDRGGVPVRVLETGQVSTTDANGRFFFGSLPAGAVTLDFGTSLAVLAQSGPGGGGADDTAVDDNGVDPLGSEVEDEAEEDDDDNPIVGGMDDGATVEVRAAVAGGTVTEVSVASSDRVRAMARLVRDAGSPDADVEGKVKVESRSDRERFSIEAEHLTPSTVVEFFLDDPSDATGFVSIGTAAALADGEAKLERNTRDGDSLPMGASAAADLAGFLVEVRLAGSGELLLTGEVPDLPDATVTPGTPGEDGRSRGRARLAPHVAGLEGEVEIRQRLERNEQRFEMKAEHLAPGTPVAFWIEDPDALGSFIRIAGRTADGEGESEINTNDGDPMPLGVTDVADLVGLQVRVTRDDGSDEVLLSGSVPPLVAD